MLHGLIEDKLYESQKLLKQTLNDYITLSNLMFLYEYKVYDAHCEKEIHKLYNSLLQEVNRNINKSYGDLEEMMEATLDKLQANLVTIKRRSANTLRVVKG